MDKDANPRINTYEASTEDLVKAVERIALEDADRVVFFLANLGLGATAEHPFLIPAPSLLALATGLRLLAWESNGFSPHRDVGLPSGEEVIRSAIEFANTPRPVFAELYRSGLRLSLEQFAWHGPSEVGANILLGEVDDELLLEAVADFLWKHRPR